MRAKPTQIAIDIIKALREVSEPQEQYKRVKSLLGEDTPLNFDSEINKEEREQRIISALTGLYNMISYDNINSKLFQNICEAITLVQRFVSPKILQDTDLQNSIKAIGEKITDMEKTGIIEEEKITRYKELVGGLLIKSEAIKSILPKELVLAFTDENQEISPSKKETPDNTVPIIIGEFKQIIATSKQEEIKKQYAVVKEILGQNSQPILGSVTKEKIKNRYNSEQVDRKNNTISEFSKLLNFITSDDISSEDFQRAYEATRLIQAFVSPAILEDKNVQNAIKLLGDKIVALENVNPKETRDYDKILKCRELAGGILIKSDVIKSVLPEDVNTVKINLWALPSREDIAKAVYTEDKSKEAIDLLKMKSIDTTSNSNSYVPKPTILEKPVEIESIDAKEVEQSKKGKSKFAAAFEKVKNKFKTVKPNEIESRDANQDKLVETPTLKVMETIQEVEETSKIFPSSKLKRSESKIDYDAEYKELDKLMGIEPSNSKVSSDIELTPKQLKANKIFAEIDSFIASSEEFKEISDDGLELMEGFKEEKDIEELDKLLGNEKGSDSKLSSAKDDLLQIEKANDFAKEAKEFDDLTRGVSDVSNELESHTKESDRTAKANAERKELLREKLRKEPPKRKEAIKQGLTASKINTDGGRLL